jgi:F-type H+-transporting ATPase subunit c
VGAVDTGFGRTHKAVCWNWARQFLLESEISITIVVVRPLVKENKMRKFITLFLVVLGTLMLATPVLAQPQTAEAAAASATGYKYIAAGIGFAIAVFGGAIGQSRVAAAACEGTARNPGASARIQTMMILGLALIESLVLFALLVVFTGIKA